MLYSGDSLGYIYIFFFLIINGFTHDDQYRSKTYVIRDYSASGFKMWLKIIGLLLNPRPSRSQEQVESPELILLYLKMTWKHENLHRHPRPFSFPQMTGVCISTSLGSTHHRKAVRDTHVLIWLQSFHWPQRGSRTWSLVECPSTLLRSRRFSPLIYKRNRVTEEPKKEPNPCWWFNPTSQLPLDYTTVWHKKKCEWQNYFYFDF